MLCLKLARNRKIIHCIAFVVFKKLNSQKQRVECCLSGVEVCVRKIRGCQKIQVFSHKECGDLLYCMGTVVNSLLHT
jgi:hypothetical protein